MLMTTLLLMFTPVQYKGAKRSALFWIGLLLLVPGSPLVALAQSRAGGGQVSETGSSETRQPPDVASAPRTPEELPLRDSVRDGVLKVLRAHQDLYDRGLIEPDGRPARMQAAQKERAFVRDRISRRLFLPEDSHRNRPWSLARTLEAYLANQGACAAAEAFASDPDLNPADLLVLAETAWLEAACLLPLERAEEQRAQLANRRELPDLGNGSARYLLFGFVALPSFWQRREAGAKEAFLLDLFTRAELDPRAAEVVAVALEPPMRLRWPLTQEQRTIAGPFVDLREPVGFTTEHLDHLRAIERSLALVRRDERLREAIEPEWTLDEAGGWVRAPQAHLARWVSDRKVQVLDELFGMGMGLRVLRDGTLADRMAFWDRAAETWPYAQFRAEVLADLRELVEWRDTHELEPRIRALSGDRAAGVLDANGQAELTQLERQLDLERRQLVGHLMRRLGGSGEARDSELAFETLCSDVPATLGDLDPISVEQFLAHGWLTFAARPNPSATQQLQVLADGGEPISDAAFQALLVQLRRQEDPDRDVLLERLTASGPASQRLACVRAASQTLPTGRAVAVWRDILYSGQTSNSGSGPGKQGGQRAPTAIERDAVLSTLASWPDRVGASQFLVEIIESGVFDGNGPASWSHHSPEGRGMLVSLLTPDQRLELVARGAWPSALAGLGQQ